MKKTISILLAVTIFLSIFGCTAAPEEISIAEENVSLLTGDKYTLDYLIQPGNAKYELMFSTSNNSIVTVNDGVLSAIAPGQATVTISTDNNLSKVWNIVVSDPPAMDQLSSTERAFLRILLSNINSFNVPSSLRIQKIGKLSSKEYRISVKVQNRIGTTLTGTYDMAYATIKETSSSITSSDSSINVDLINVALEEFWE